MYSEEDLIKEKEQKKEEEKRKRINTFLGSKNKNIDPAQQEQEEEFYDDFFRYENDNKDFNIEEEPSLETEEKKESRSSLVGIVILLLIFSVLGILFVKSYSSKEKKVDEKEPTVTITEANGEVDEGSEYKLKYSFDNFSDDPKVTFVSSDETVATVNNEGVVKGVKAGTTKIIMSYYIKGVSYQKEFSVKVNAVEKEETPPEPEPEKPTPAKDTTKPTLNVSIANAKENVYVNHDVTINVSASDNSGKVSTQYAINCSSSCKYQNVSGGKITLNSDGNYTVSIQAVDSSGNKTSKNVTIKIDKTKPTCALKVSSDGTISSTNTDNSNSFVYYGFNKDHAGTKENSKKVTSEGTYNYYVLDSAGNSNTCSITVKAKTQYRSRTCDTANRKFSSWRVRKQVYITSCGKYTKYEAEKAGNTWYRTRSDADASKCNGSSPCYYCTAYIRYITGCNWKDEPWGAYQDTAIQSSDTVQVESKKIFYQ